MSNEEYLQLALDEEIQKLKEFEDNIILLLSDITKIERRSKKLKLKIKILYGRIIFQINKVNLYREARDFYSTLKKLVKSKKIHEIHLAFNKLSKENKDLILDMAEPPFLAIFLKTGRNPLNYSNPEILSLLEPTYSDLNSKRFGYLTENIYIRIAIKNEIENFLSSFKNKSGKKLSLYNSSMIVDKGGQDESLAKSGQRFQGTGVNLFRFIDNYFDLNKLIDRPVTYSIKKS